MKHLVFVGFIILTGACLCEQAFAQHEATLYFMNSIPQAGYLNPATQPKYSFSIGLPGSSVFAQYNNNGFTYNDFAVKQGDSVIGDLNKLQRAMKKKNYVGTSAQADLFRVNLKVNARLFVSWNITAKSYNRVMVPKELSAVFIDGTSVLENNPVSGSPQVESVSYIESAWGASYTVNRKLTVGARFKLLKGMVNATTIRSNMDLSMDDNYHITAIADAELRTSGVHQLDEDDNFEMKDDWEVYKSNTGFAFDLGATYKLMDDKLTLGLSLIDIGSITWKNDTYSYTLDPATANITFKGVDLEKVLNGQEDYLESIGDSIEANFKFVKTPIQKYRLPLPGKMYLSASYAWRETVSFNALLFAEKFRGRFSPGFSVSMQKDFGRIISTSLSYTLTNASFNNIGAGISLNLAPIQLYVVSDNILRAPISLLTDGNVNSYVNNAKFVNVRAGLNFVFGRIKKQERLPSPSL
ncbi:DUF5723 family protein [Chryseolinea lacunae]|uniref:DUF5723 domain-containing protein n=1 Tax=Chryseolinea lacunae TaxID=2801331 RepID=A0ABS1KS43_9BACT|nr:DUF5723 family protein [Chryseolinea lacunae]MBL0742276.1 hypothetical protein [Chryseolinea lacunae]